MNTVHLVELPRTIRSVTVPNDNGTIDIYVNTSLLEKSKELEKSGLTADVLRSMYGSEPEFDYAE